MKHKDPMLRIRLPAELKEWLEQEAKRNCRSQNGEIVYRLESSRHPARSGGAPAAGAAFEA